MKILLTVVITLAVLIIIGLIFMYSGIYNVAAINPPGNLESWFFSTVMDNSVEHHSAGIKAPALDGAATIDSGFQHYSRMCAGCHGAPGISARGTTKGFNPQPPDLVDAVGDQSDAQIFWIVKNGIKMTAMPAYGVNIDDNRIWEIVAFVHPLPKMTAEQYQGYKTRLGQEEPK
jgi:mono/diheme cytochrome c family protein